MPLDKEYNKHKEAFVESLTTSKGPNLGPSLIVEVPVDRTSKYGLPVPMLMLYRLSGNNVGLEPDEVRNLTIWKPARKGASTPNPNRRKVPEENIHRVGKKVGFYCLFVEGPDSQADTSTGVGPGIWRTYTTTGTHGGLRKLRFIKLKVPYIFSISCVLFMFSHYWSIKPMSVRSYNRMYSIPDKTTFVLNKLGELTAGKTEAPNQQQGEISAGGAKQGKNTKDK